MISTDLLSKQKPAKTLKLKPILKTRNLSVSYGNTAVLENINLDIYPNTITALIGPSGCGKSSLIRCLNKISNMYPECRVKGDIFYKSKEISTSFRDIYELRRKIGMIFQQPNPFVMSIRQNLELPLREIGIRNSKILSQKVEEALRGASLWNEVKDRLNESALNLSGGQKQRLCIARAIILKPDILLLDEPCSALDPKSCQAIESLLLRLKTKCTIVIITHNLSQAGRISDYVAVLGECRKGSSLLNYLPTHEFNEKPRQTLGPYYLQAV